MTDWPHPPVHRLPDAGAYIVTAGTYNKASFFEGPERLSFLRDSLLSLAARYEWFLQAWSIFSNHYHFVGLSQNPASLPRFISHLHTITAKEINLLENQPGRKVWFQYWDKQLTFPRSYFARLNYVMQNPVHHGVVQDATEYPWCSASWFERTGRSGFKRLVKSFKIDRVKVYDDF